MHAYLLVYIAVGDEHDAWADIGNDPDFRQTPFTWGICRTNVRGWARPGDDLFFIAKRSRGPLEDRYFLRARFHVQERLDHAQARRRFGPRQNVIIDELPAGRDLRSRVDSYISEWKDQLQWDDGHPDLALLASGNWSETDFTVEATPGQWSIHSYWDPHTNWKSRQRSPYVLADESLSQLLPQPIRWADVASRSEFLPRPEALTNKSNRHAAQRVWHSSDLELLSGIFAESATRRSAVGGIAKLQGV